MSSGVVVVSSLTKLLRSKRLEEPQRAEHAEHQVVRNLQPTLARSPQHSESQHFHIGGLRICVIFELGYTPPFLNRMGKRRWPPGQGGVRR